MGTSGWRALGSLAPRSLVVPASLQPASCSAMSAERMHQLAERLSPVSTSLVNSRGISTSAVQRSDEEKGPAMDQAAMSRKVDPAEAAMKKAANEMAKKAANKKKDSGKSKKEGAADKAASEKAAAEKATAEKVAAEKAAAEKAAAKKAAAEKAAGEKAAAEKAAAEAAAKAEAAAIANMRDPIQELFLTSIRAYGSSGGLASADAAAQDALKAELERVARQYGIEAGEDVTAFPSFEFSDKPVDPINISQ